MTWDHGIVQIKAAAEGHVWVLDLATVRFYVDVCDSRDHQRPC